MQANLIPASLSPSQSLKLLITSLNYRLVTISVQPERENAVTPRGKWFSPKNRVRAIPVLDLLPEDGKTSEVQIELQALQQKGNAIYFMVNEGNGVPKEPEAGNLNCGRRENVITLKALFIDTDSADFDALWQKLREIHLAPHFIFESSPKKFHLYFLLNEVTAEGENIDQWKALIELLDDLVPGLDQSMSDINQILRLPAFFNLKPELTSPFRVKLVSHAKDLPPYDLSELYVRLKADRYDTSRTSFSAHALSGAVSNGNLNGELLNGHYNKFTYPEDYVKAGGRRKAITGFIERMLENLMPLHAEERDHFIAVDGFINKYIAPNERADFLEGGKRRQNILTYYREQKERRISLNQAKERFIVNQQFEHLDAVKDRLLPDEFYLNFPGDLGFITREIHAYFPNLALEMCFAGALMISGALKAEKFRLKGLWPFVNGLVIAGTGAGKSTLKEIVERTLRKAGLGGQYPQVFDFHNTVQALHQTLYSAGGVGTCIVDESGDYLENITSKYAPAYAKALKKYFKEATTGRSEGTRLHPGLSMSYPVPAIEGGMLSLWLMIQPDKFTGTLSLEDMSDGFLPRFFIFNGKSNLDFAGFKEDDSEDKSFEPSVDFEVYIESFVAIQPVVNVKAVTEEAEKELKEQGGKIKKDQLAAVKRDAVYQARSEARNLSLVEVKFEPQAMEAVRSYLEEREAEAKKVYTDDGENAPSIGIYIRMKEMLFRLMCNAAPKEAVVSLEIAQACIKFHKFQTDRFFRNELVEISKGREEREAEVALKALRKLYMEEKKPYSHREIHHAIKHTARPKNLKMTLENLVQQGLMMAVRVPHGLSQKGEAKILKFIPLEES